MADQQAGWVLGRRSTCSWRSLTQSKRTRAAACADGLLRLNPPSLTPPYRYSPTVQPQTNVCRGLPPATADSPVRSWSHCTNSSNSSRMAGAQRQYCRTRRVGEFKGERRLDRQVGWCCGTDADVAEATGTGVGHFSLCSPCAFSKHKYAHTHALFGCNAHAQDPFPLCFLNTPAQACPPPTRFMKAPAASQHWADGGVVRLSR